MCNPPGLRSIRADPNWIIPMEHRISAPDPRPLSYPSPALLRMETGRNRLSAISR